MEDYNVKQVKCKNAIERGRDAFSKCEQKMVQFQVLQRLTKRRWNDVGTHRGIGKVSQKNI